MGHTVGHTSQGKACGYPLSAKPLYIAEGVYVFRAAYFFCTLEGVGAMPFLPYGEHVAARKLNDYDAIN